jgi:hypothetical protein
MHYNTTNETGETLKRFEAKAETQEHKIGWLFKKHPDKDFTPFEVQIMLDLATTPITSIRRTMTDLTELGVLVKTEKKKIERYGRMNCTWKLNV